MNLEHMRELWDGSEGLSAAVIGERFGVSKNVVIGIAHRKGWGNRPSKAELAAPRPKTLHDRMAALHAMMDQVLSECGHVGRVPNLPPKRYGDARQKP